MSKQLVSQAIVEAIRPIRVETSDGRSGTINPSNRRRAGKDWMFLVEFEAGHQVWAHSKDLETKDDGSVFFKKAFDEIDNQGESDERLASLPVIEEKIKVEKRKIVTGKVKISKRVRERIEVVDTPGYEEKVDIERVAINRVIDQPVSIRQEGETVIIPIIEEKLVVEKRLILKEEVRITRQRIEIHHPEKVTLRSEELDIERIDLRTGDSTSEEEI